MRWKSLVLCAAACLCLVAVPSCDWDQITDPAAAANKAIDPFETQLRDIDTKLLELRQAAEQRAASDERDKALEILDEGRKLTAQGLDTIKDARAVAATLKPAATGPPGDWTWWGLGIWAVGATLRAVQNRAGGRNIAASLAKAQELLSAGATIAEGVAGTPAGPLGSLSGIIKKAGLQGATAERMVDEAQGKAVKLPL